MSANPAIFNRTIRLVGNETMDVISSKRVIIFGVGGVGSWCAESLVRSGIKYLTIVDSDVVNVTNVNRQLMATTKTVGQVKVDVLKQRLLEINPDAEIEARAELYSEQTSASFHLGNYDYIIDAIDSLDPKMNLLMNASRTKAKVFASMGAALKIDPTKIKVAEFWDAKGCPLARALRDKFKKKQLRPAKKIKVVYSEELLVNKGPVANDDGSPAEFRKVAYNGTMAHAVAIFGFTIAGLVMKDIYDKAQQ
ncbi:ThiF family adenylyltransferase [Fibrobacter sp. UWEL]|uniref:tRNA threonylcarbamoyladenosine dehydratase n=1 Tax=Fibrobacter sp. UWEL TaxID=1896209 RepID=UPI000917CF0C|nr:tRNA threonylcarbamoyladenosine dehydratase [Fibrobacter sp. UWEL]SHK81934.1 tRNA A37 threonylcarbamoyladenosine dehydratase [Fibrobacter sp. UWEL]